jgi:hypothetical protein
LKPVWQIVPPDTVSKNPSQKMAGGMAQDVDLEFKLQYHKKKKKKKRFKCYFKIIIKRKH